MVNEFSWSTSRNDLFHFCKRKYYFSYYAHWGGWKEDAPELARQIYFLKNRDMLELWAGSVVHRAIRYAIVNRHKVDPAFVANALVRRLVADHATSLARDRATMKPKDFWLYEHYLGQEVDMDAVQQKSVRCLENFYKTTFFQELKEMPGDSPILYIDPEKPDVVSMRFGWNGYYIYAVPDLCHRNQEGVIRLLDWKTGRAPESELSEQLKIYTWRLFQLDGIDPDLQEVQAHSVYLQDNSLRGRRVTKADVEQTEAAVWDSIRGMKAFLADEEKNLAQEMEQFPMADAKRKCSSCVYREVCLG